MARRPAVHPGSEESPLWLLGWDRVWGGLVVDGCLGFRGPGWPNGPQSPRLAPGGFYEAWLGRD